MTAGTTPNHSTVLMSFANHAIRDQERPEERADGVERLPRSP
jgi:hypothetical protein